MKGGQAMVDMVATTPRWRVAVPIIAASGSGSCSGTSRACLRVASEVPRWASETISVSSSMM